MYRDQVPTPHYGQPRYRAIAEQLRQRIENGDIPPGTLLPPESTLVDEFHASRETIRRALAALRDDGLVVTEARRGTLAAPTQQAGTVVAERKISADDSLAALFEVPAGTPLIEQESVTREADGVQAVTRRYTLADRSASR